MTCGYTVQLEWNPVSDVKITAQAGRYRFEIKEVENGFNVDIYEDNTFYRGDFASRKDVAVAKCTAYFREVLDKAIGVGS